ncbi:MAG TPA: hypothetical protein PLN63_04745, partial [Paludibacteraceae bacterium]|nr:hypothetical protein [Paludibacteraceae bacterium]
YAQLFKHQFINFLIPPTGNHHIYIALIYNTNIYLLPLYNNLQEKKKPHRFTSRGFYTANQKNILKIMKHYI